MTPHRIVVVALIVLALTLLARAQTTPSPELATRLDEAIRLLEAGRASDARPKLDAVIADARSADDKVTEGHALGRLGRALQVLGDHAGARARFDDAERVLTEVGDPYTLGLLLNARAQFFYARGESPAAEADWGRALEMFERSGRPRDQARTLYSLTFVRRHDPAHVVALLERASRLAHDAAAPEIEGLILQRWSDEDVLRGDYGAALEKIRAAVATLERAGQPVQIARALTSLGRVYRLHGSYDDALTAFERALALHRTTSDVPGIGQSMNAVAVALRVLGRTSDAIATAQSAVRYLEEHEDRTGTLALACQTLATALEDDGKPGAALQAVERGLAASPTPVDRSLLLGTRASLLSALGRAEEADAALSNAESEASPRQDIRAVLLGTRAELLARAGHIDQALDVSATLIQAFEEQRTRAAPVDGLKSGFDNVRQWAWAQRVRLLADAGRHSEALEVTEGARARALADLLAARRLHVASAESGDHRGDGRPPVAATDPVGSGVPEAEFSRTRVPIASPVAAAPPRLSDIAAHAARLESTVLAYWVERDAVRIWTVDGAANVRHAVVRIDARRLAALVRSTWSTDDVQARAVAAAGRANPRPAKALRALRELYELLITPVAKALPRFGDRRITVVPHGPLFRLSFAALRSASGRYLLEDFEVHYTPSMGILGATEAASGRAATGGVLVVAAPTLSRSAREGGLDPLPGAEAEGRAVSSVLAVGAEGLLIGAGATESQVRRLAGGKRVLHFASHAVVSDDHPLDSFLSLADEAEGSGAADARLTAEEVYGLRLDADLAVLSACRTGGGRVTGDGMGALVRAFAYAGTPSVVATLWDLPDVSGAFALPRFYRERGRGAGKARALRTAQVALLQALRAGRVTVDTAAGRFTLPEHPKYWAGFVITGEP